MYKWPSRPPMAVLRPSLSLETVPSLTTTLRSFHLSGRYFEKSDNGSSTSTTQSRQDRLHRSRTAFSQISSLKSKSSHIPAPQSPVGIRGGAFRSRNQITSTQPPPSGAVMARRREPPAASRSKRAAAGGRRTPNASARSQRSKKSSSSATSRRRDDQPSEEEMNEATDGSEELPDGLVRYLLAQYERHHGDKPYDPDAAATAELLAWTDGQLPPLASAAPQDVLRKHLEGAVTHRPEFAMTPTMDPVKQDARRLVAGHLVKFEDERIKKGALLLANAPRMQRLRKEEAEKQGLDPGASIEFAELPDSLRREVERNVLAGKYELTDTKAKSKQEMVMKNTLKALQGNASYKPANVARFLDAVEGLLQGKPRPTAPQIERSS